MGYLFCNTWLVLLKIKFPLGKCPQKVGDVSFEFGSLKLEIFESAFDNIWGTILTFKLSWLSFLH